jgi:hypothetical protein
MCQRSSTGPNRGLGPQRCVPWDASTRLVWDKPGQLPFHSVPPRAANPAPELIAACSLHPGTDAPRIALMLELVERARSYFARSSQTEQAPTSTKKRKQLELALAGLAKMIDGYDAVRRASATWSVGGPVGSPDLARLPTWRRLAHNLALPELLPDYAAVYERDGRRVDAIDWLEPADLPPPKPGASGRRVDFRKLSTTIQDAAFVRPELLGKLLEALADAAQRTRDELAAASQARKSEAPRNTFMCHVALVFHAMHRVRSRGRKAARVRFVRAGLASVGRSIETKAVENELRRSSFLRDATRDPEPMGDVPEPLDFDTDTVLAALKTPLPRAHRIDERLLERLEAAAFLLTALPDPPQDTPPTRPA